MNLNKLGSNLSSLSRKFALPSSLVIGLILLRVLLPWTLHYLKWGGPLSSIVVYREQGRDLTYLPAIAGVAKFGLHDGGVFEHAGKGVISYGLGTLVWISALFKIFGAYGFLLADLIGIFLNFFAIRYLLITLGIRQWISEWFALVLISGAWNKVLGASIVVRGALIPSVRLSLFATLSILTLLTLKSKKLGLSLIAFGAAIFIAMPDSSWMYLLWIPRQFIAEIYFLILLAFIYRLWTQATIRGVEWPIMGGLSALLLHGSPYQALILLFLGGAIFALRFRKIRFRPVNLMAFLCVAAALLIPFILQRLSETSDVQIRMGQFAVDRFHPWLLPAKALQGPMLILSLLFIGLWTWISRRSKNFDLPIFLTLLGASAYFSLPLNMILFGKLAQIQHYGELFFEISGMIGILVFLRIFSDWQPWTDISRRKKFATLALLIVPLVGTCMEARKASQLQMPIRPDMGEWTHPEIYRRDFVSLVRFLNTLSFKKVQTLATFDLQLDDWWMMFGGGYWVNPDPFFTAISDSEIEDRMIFTCKIMGMTREEFLTYIQKPSVTLYYLSHDKYQASRAHVYSDASDYTSEDLKNIQNTSILETWNVILPQSQVRRLSERFDQIPSSLAPKTDAVILTSDINMSDRSVVDPAYELAYQNASFRVWLRKQ